MAADVSSIVNLVSSIMNLRGITYPMTGSGRSGGAYWPPNQTIGDPPGTQGDETYTDFDGSNPLSLDYYRQQLTNFQMVMNQLDQMYQVLTGMWVGDMDDQTYSDLQGFAQEISSKRDALSAAALAAQGLSIAANAVGIRLPSPSMPNTLGVAPAVIIGSAAVIAAIAGLVYWAHDFMTRVQTYMTNSDVISRLTPDQAAAFALQSQKITDASNSSFTSNLAATAKWVVIGILAYLAYDAFAKGKR